MRTGLPAAARASCNILVTGSRLSAVPTRIRIGVRMGSMFLREISGSGFACLKRSGPADAPGAMLIPRNHKAAGAPTIAELTGTLETRFMTRLPPRLTPYRFKRFGSTYGRDFAQAITDN